MLWAQSFMKSQGEAGPIFGRGGDLVDWHKLNKPHQGQEIPGTENSQRLG